MRYGSGCRSSIAVTTSSITGTMYIDARMRALCCVRRAGKTPEMEWPPGQHSLTGRQCLAGQAVGVNLRTARYAVAAEALYTHSSSQYKQQSAYEHAPFPSMGLGAADLWTCACAERHAPVRLSHTCLR